MVCALGLRDRLVARSHECDFPPGVEELPALTRARVGGAAPSGVIDRQVRALLASGGPLYDVDEGRLLALAPDVVVTQEACEVCAVSYQQVAGCVARAGLGSTIVSLGPARLEDVLGDVGRVARACGVAEAGAALEADLRARLRLLRERAQAAAGGGGVARVAAAPFDAATPFDAAPPFVAVIEWLDPPMLAGHWVPDVVAAAGGVPLGPSAGAQSPYVSWEEIAALAPDVVVVAPCGFDLERVEVEAAPYADRLCALAPRVLLLDGNAYLNRPGPRLVDAAEILAGLLGGARLPRQVAAAELRRARS
jgi:iron complex transport system substrate-binding protein